MKLLDYYKVAALAPGECQRRRRYLGRQDQAVKPARGKNTAAEGRAFVLGQTAGFLCRVYGFGPATANLHVRYHIHVRFIRRPS